MGIYDRDYYRREGPSFLGTITDTGQVCKWLILVNVAVFVIQVLTGLMQPTLVMRDGHPAWSYGFFTDFLELDTNAVLDGQVWRLLTSAFLHADLWHIVFNMLFLWWFGKDVEDIYGPREFLTFYLVSALAGSAAYTLQHAATGALGLALGASGAVTAVLVLCALHFPTRMVLVMFFLPVPIWLFVVFQVAQDVLDLLSKAQGVGWAAHLGGAAFAFTYYKLQWRLTNLLPDLRSWQRRRGRPRLRIYRDDDEERPTPVSVAAAPPSNEADEQFKARVDAVLEKMTRHGKDSLTESEQQLLLRASEIYRRRRP